MATPTLRPILNLRTRPMRRTRTLTLTLLPTLWRTRRLLVPTTPTPLPPPTTPTHLYRRSTLRPQQDQLCHCLPRFTAGTTARRPTHTPLVMALLLPTPIHTT